MLWVLKKPCSMRHVASPLTEYPFLHLPGTWAKRVKVVRTYCINVPVSESTANVHTDTN